MKLSGKQIKAARAMLNWSRGDLAALSGVSEPNIIRLEAGGEGRAETLRKITDSFENHGIVFTINGGVDPARPELRTYTGQSGLHHFFDDVYETTKENGGEIVITGFAESQFDTALDPEFDKMHMERMVKLSNFSMRCLVEDGDFNFFSSYCQYRWTPRGQFSPVPFYIYGNKIAFIQFNVLVDAPLIVVLQSKAITDSFRIQFEELWRSARIPVKY